MNEIVKIFSASIISLSLMLTLPAYAATSTSIFLTEVRSSPNLSQNIQDRVNKTKSKLEDIVENTLVSEAQAVLETQKALKALESATDKLDLVLARNLELGFVPLSEVDILALAPSDLDTVEEIRKEVKAVRKEELVGIRELLNNLACELRITTVNLPLATYPAAMEAATLLDRDEYNAAQRILQTVLSTLFVEAQALIDEANSLIQVDGHEEIVQSLLAEARKELRLAEELDYGDRDEKYAQLDSAIDDIKKQISVGERVEIAFGILKTS